MSVALTTAAVWLAAGWAAHEVLCRGWLRTFPTLTRSENRTWWAVGLLFGPMALIAGLFIYAISRPDDKPDPVVRRREDVR